MSTFAGYLIPKASLSKKNSNTLKVYIIAGLVFKFAYFKATVQHFNHYTMETSF